ncbi:MAG TPA: S8 family serine peptidase [Herpetosiphonaceae bacterium]|nr:S8 family serine peptidase [Herpetosiphonaceae bacterium]
MIGRSTDTLPPGLDPIFEGFAIEMARPRQKQKLRQIIAQELGNNWWITAFGDTATDFDVTLKQANMRVDQAWELAYRLRARPGIVYAEPIFAAAVSNRLDWNQPPVTRDGAPEGRIEPGAALPPLCLESEPLPASDDPEWSLSDIRVFQAWQRFFSDPQHVPGEGVLVGHPDTGYILHPEIVANLSDDGYDFVQNDEDARDELQQGPLQNPGHGTATASVIVSPRGMPRGSTTPPAVTGVAPGARLIPIRVSPSVVLLSTLNLARAIEYAARRGVHVISISMGGIFSWRLRKAITFAQHRGIIVLAAAGNCVPFVVWPAAYDEVIAVAASNADHETWRGSSRGRAVDVTAPGESVWHAGVDLAAGQTRFTVGRGSGTSYAVASVAGVAALWLARHGRDQLTQRYGAEKIPFIFNQILRNTCTPMTGPTWIPGEFGTGLVNAEAVLDAPLPAVSTSAIPAPAHFLQPHVTLDAGGLVTFAHLFEQSLHSHLGRGAMANGAVHELPLEAHLAELLNSTEAQLPSRLKEIGQELAFHFVANPSVYRQFEASLAHRRIPTVGELPAARTADDQERTRALLISAGASPLLRAQLEPTAHPIDPV